MIHLSLCRLVGALAWATMACAAALPLPAFGESANTGAFRNLNSVESTLLRGVTSKAEVRRELGIPNGSGATQFASLGGDVREIWYYEDIALTGVRSVDKDLRIDMRQQILLVIFKGEMVDGYMWTSNSGAVSAQ